MARTSFPIGQIGLDASPLRQADNVNIDTNNSLALKGTLANRNGSPVVGMLSVTFTWDMLVDNNGPELAMLRAVSEGAPMALSWEFPGGFSLGATATAASATITQSLGSECKIACKAMGQLDSSNGF